MCAMRTQRRKDTNQRMQEILDEGIIAHVPDWSEAYHAEARRLRGLYNVGGASDLVVGSLPAYSNYPAPPVGRAEVPAEETRPWQESPHAEAEALRRQFAADAKAGAAVDHRDPWYHSGAGLGSTAPLAVRTRYDARPEMVARRADLHASRYAALPVDEWVPQIVAGSRWEGYTRAPRNWPREAEFTTRSDRIDQAAKTSLATDAPSRPSYVRETTVPHAMSELQMALAHPQAQRGNRRLAQRNAARNARILTDALEERKVHQRRHADWLETSGGSAEANMRAAAAAAAGKKKPPGVVRSRKQPSPVKRSTYAADQARAMGVRAAPSNVYRESMRQSGSGMAPSSVTRTSSVRSIGAMSAVLQPSHDELFQRSAPLSHDDQLIERGVARKLKAREMRFDGRFRIVGHVLATLHKAATAAPGNQQLIKLHGALKSCGVENSDPLAVSRAQFVAITTYTLGNDGITARMADLLYSSFDPERRDRARYACICCGMMMANRPEVYKLVGATGGDHGKFSDLLPVLRAVFQVFDNEELGITPNDCRDILTLPALHEDDVLAMDALWTEGAKLFKVVPRDKIQRIKWDIFFGALSKQRGCVIFKELQRQLKAYQGKIHETTLAERD